MSGSSLRIRHFFDGTEPPSTLALVVEAFGRKSSSFFYAARSQDVEWYEATHDDRETRPVSVHPDPVDFGTIESLLATLIELTQANNHYSAQAKGKPKVRRIPRPESAADIHRRKRSREAYEQIESALNFVSPDELSGPSVSEDIK